MYHPTKVAAGLRQVEELYRFTPEYHSIDEVEVYSQYLRDQGKLLYDDQGRPFGTQKLDEYDHRWMMNERCLVMSDAMYGITRYGFVINEEGVIQRFNPRVAQSILFDIIGDLESRDVAIERSTARLTATSLFAA